MMDPSARREQLIRLLRRGASMSVHKLARGVGASRRTVLRDLGALRDRGFVIDGEGGRGGGVRLDTRSVMVSAQLTVEEVVALILSVAVLRAAPSMPLAGRAEDALSKIERALSAERVAELRRVMRNILVGDPADERARASAGPVDPSLLECFERAFSQSYVMEFEYLDRNARTSSRCVEPQAILVRAPLWYIIAWDQRKDAPRLFRMDRIRGPRVQDERKFRPRPMELVLGVCPDARERS
jgi:predicted DNA-binding transcriptional regulator YafY